MTDEIISEIEEMERDEFSEFSRYVMNVSGNFIQANYEVAEAVADNVEKLSEAGGNAIVVGRLDAILMRTDGPEEYARELRTYRDDSEYGEIVDTTVEELFSSFFDEDEDFEYSLE